MCTLPWPFPSVAVRTSRSDRPVRLIPVTAAPLQALILAAGKGTRMKSGRAKVLHPVLGVPLLEHVLRTVEVTGAAPVTVVVGHQAEAVEATFAGRGLTFVRQDPPRGT